MSRGAEWFASRRPEPPADLALRFPELKDAQGQALVDELAQAAREALDRARANPGRVRDAALDLLVADALYTYACEAALELADPAKALRSLMDQAVEAPS